MILQDVELVMRNALGHKVAVAAGVDDAQKAILEGPKLSRYSGMQEWKVTRKF